MFTLRDEGPGPCDEGERELEGIWDDGVKREVEQAFRATAAPYSEEAWSGTTRHLDRFAAEWVTTHKRVCLSGSNCWRFANAVLLCC